LSALRTLCQFEVPQNIPLEGSIGYGDLARKSKLNETTLIRCVRLVMTKYFFAEPELGFVAHSTRSRMLATNEAMRVRFDIFSKRLFLTEMGMYKLAAKLICTCRNKVMRND